MPLPPRNSKFTLQSDSNSDPSLPLRFRLRAPASLTPAKRLNLERETGIEPATNSLEGCDSTTELLPLKSAVSYQPSALSKKLSG